MVLLSTFGGIAAAQAQSPLKRQKVPKECHSLCCYSVMMRADGHRGGAARDSPYLCNVMS
jgi:hypothetical protein